MMGHGVLNTCCWKAFKKGDKVCPVCGNPLFVIVNGIMGGEQVQR